MKNTLKVVLVIVGTIIGAGFASGKEIYIFFGMRSQLFIIGNIKWMKLILMKQQQFKLSAT